MSHLRIALTHLTGSPFSRQAAIALWEAGMLHKVVTTLDYHPDSALGRVLKRLPKRISQPLDRELSRRSWSLQPRLPIHSHPWREISRVAIARSGLSGHLGWGSLGPVDWVYRGLDRHVAKHHLANLDAVYCYEDLAYQTFIAAKARGMRCFYDLPILFHRMSGEIQAEEAERFPELASALQAIHDPPWKLHQKSQELQLADRIFVASSITRQSLLAEGVEPGKISVIPYGAPIDYFHPKAKPDDRFRALFVGRVGPRKGVHYLLQAWEDLHLPEAELMLVGVNEFPAHWLAHYTDQFQYIPCVPHADLNHYYSTANVFVFPSLVEGFGLVLLEAMACGIPVITTPNTAGPDILTDGVEGFIIPIRDVEVLKAKLEWCYKHPTELAEMGQAARRKAEQLTWERYRQRLILDLESSNLKTQTLKLKP
jgi:glycosyltransferase involved in cell wall biosynthesis